MTSRVTIDSADPHAVGQAAEKWLDIIQLYVTHAAVAGHTLVVLSGLAAQLASESATFPSLPTHIIVRVTVDEADPHAIGQAAEKALNAQLYVGQTATAGQTAAVTGLASRHLSGALSVLVLVPVQVTARL
jgi:hypothetical protein